MLSDLERLMAVEEIKKLKARYFRLLDAHDWDAFADVFTDDVVFDVAESSSGASTKDQFLASVREHLTTAVSVHHGHTPEIEIVDDTSATGIWAMFDRVEPPPGSDYPVLTGAGHYHEEYRREAGQWRISRLALTRIKRETSLA